VLDRHLSIINDRNATKFYISVNAYIISYIYPLALSIQYIGDSVYLENRFFNGGQSATFIRSQFTVVTHLSYC